MARALEPPRDLAVPRAGSTTARNLVSLATARVLREAPALLREAARAAGASGFEAWAKALVAQPGAAADLLRRPHLGGIVRVLRAEAVPARGGLLVELLATLAYELEAMGAVDAPLRMERRPARVLALRARRALDVALGVAREPYHVLDRELVLALEDSSPLAMTEAHPDKRGNAVSLGGAPLEAWVEGLREALALLRDVAPEFAAELDLCVHVFVPVGFDREAHLSATYREIPGTIYLTLHPDPVVLAEAIVHELSHTKLNLLWDLDPVLAGDGAASRHASPLRPDPRPLSGVLLGTHALVAMGHLHARLREAGHPRSASPAFASREAEIRRGVSEGLTVLAAHADPTEAGAALLAEMTAWAAVSDRALRG